jgi:hypothetical protein
MLSRQKALVVTAGSVLLMAIVCPVNAAALTVQLARKCDSFTAKAYPPRVPGNPAAGLAKGSPQKARAYFHQCVVRNGKMERAAGRQEETTGASAGSSSKKPRSRLSIANGLFASHRRVTEGRTVLIGAALNLAARRAIGRVQPSIVSSLRPPRRLQPQAADHRCTRAEDDTRSGSATLKLV